eukprot:6263795-Prymnesium_polylepis.1
MRWAQPSDDGCAAAATRVRVALAQPTAHVRVCSGLGADAGDGCAECGMRDAGCWVLGAGSGGKRPKECGALTSAVAPPLRVGRSGRRRRAGSPRRRSASSSTRPSRARAS